MPKLPQLNIRLAPEHHDLIRQLAQRLRADPSLAVRLADFIAQASESDPIQVSPLPHGLADEVAELKERLKVLEQPDTQRNTDVLQAFQERLTIQSEVSRNIMAFAESINERLKALEQPETLRDTDGNTNVLQSILDRLSALERAIAQPAKARSRGRVRDAKISPPG